MRNPENVLNSLSNHSKTKDYKFERLYRILFNREMYFVAYQKIYSNEGNMTKGTDSQTIDGMSLTRIDALIEALKDESYQPAPSRRTYIPKKNGKKRPLGIPTVSANCTEVQSPFGKFNYHSSVSSVKRTML